MESMRKRSLPQVVINGERLETDSVSCLKFTGNIEQLMKDCDDYYELITDEHFIQSIKNDKKFIEITYPETIEVETIRFKIQKLDRILIPLSGKFYSGNQVTFFTGIDRYSNTPILNSHGKSGLEGILNDVKQ